VIAKIIELFFGKTRRKLAMRLHNYFYDDIHDYFWQDENVWTHEIRGVALQFPVDRERLYIIVDGMPIVAQEGNEWVVNTKGYQFQSAVMMWKRGAEVFCIHNHPGGDPTPSGKDYKVAESFPELDHYTVAIDKNNNVEEIQYHRGGVVEKVTPMVTT
jgi:proteasome lid subunit RPN8/RPN11